MANPKKSKVSGKSKGGKHKERKPSQQDDARDPLVMLAPMERVAAVAPFWQTLSHEQRVPLLTISLKDLREYAEQQTTRAAKAAAQQHKELTRSEHSSSDLTNEVLQCPTVNLEPSFEEVLTEGVSRLNNNRTTWKVWRWCEPGTEGVKEFYDAEAFRQFIEEARLSEELQRLLPKEEGKQVEKPAEEALRKRMSDLLQKIHANNRQLQEEVAFPRRTTRGGRASADAVNIAVRDTNIELITLILEAMEQEHEFLYHAVLFPVTSFVMETLPEGSRETRANELYFEDLEKMNPDDVTRIAEWLTEKVDAFSSKVKPEAKDLEEEDEEAIGDVDLFTLTEDRQSITVNAKWLQHLQERLLGEDGHPRKVAPGEDPYNMGLVLEWVFGTIVSTAEKARDCAKRGLGLRLPTALAAHEQLTHALTEQGTWENRAKQARELLNEMLKSRKETAELAKRYDIRPVVHSPPCVEPAEGGERPPPAADLPDWVVVEMLKHELLLVRAKLHGLTFEHIMGERRLRNLKNQLRQGEPEFERLKRELEDVKNAPRGLEGTFRTAAEMERHRAQLADAAIEEQLEVQTQFREHGARLQSIYDKRQRLEMDMAKKEGEMKQLQGWKHNVQSLLERFEQLLKPPTIPAEATTTTSSSTAFSNSIRTGAAAANTNHQSAEEGAASETATQEATQGDDGQTEGQDGTTTAASVRDGEGEGGANGRMGGDEEAGQEGRGWDGSLTSPLLAAKDRAVLLQGVQASQEPGLQKLRVHFFKDIRRQLYNDDDDRVFYNLITRELHDVDKRLDEGRAALHHLEMQLINVACDDPGSVIGSQLALPMLQDRLDAAAMEFAAKRAAEAEEQIMRMEEEKAERERLEKEKRAKQKQKAKEKVKSEKERLAAEREAERKAAEERKAQEEEARKQREEQERRKRLEEIERIRQEEEALMEARRRELLSEENGYWKQRMGADTTPPPDGAATGGGEDAGGESVSDKGGYDDEKEEQHGGKQEGGKKGEERKGGKGLVAQEKDAQRVPNGVVVEASGGSAENAGEASKRDAQPSSTAEQQAAAIHPIQTHQPPVVPPPVHAKHTSKNSSTSSRDGVVGGVVGGGSTGAKVSSHPTSSSSSPKANGTDVATPQLASHLQQQQQWEHAGRDKGRQLERKMRSASGSEAGSSNDLRASQQDHRGVSRERSDQPRVVDATAPPPQPPNTTKADQPKVAQQPQQPPPAPPATPAQQIAPRSATQPVAAPPAGAAQQQQPPPVQLPPAPVVMPRPQATPITAPPVVMPRPAIPYPTAAEPVKVAVAVPHQRPRGDPAAGPAHPSSAAPMANGPTQGALPAQGPPMRSMGAAPMPHMPQAVVMPPTAPGGAPVMVGPPGGGNWVPPDVDPGAFAPPPGAVGHMMPPPKGMGDPAAAEPPPPPHMMPTSGQPMMPGPPPVYGGPGMPMPPGAPPPHSAGGPPHMMPMRPHMPPPHMVGPFGASGPPHPHGGNGPPPHAAPMGAHHPPPYGPPFPMPPYAPGPPYGAPPGMAPHMGMPHATGAPKPRSTPLRAAATPFVPSSLRAAAAGSGAAAAAGGPAAGGSTTTNTTPTTEPVAPVTVVLRPPHRVPEGGAPHGGGAVTAKAVAPPPAVVTVSHPGASAATVAHAAGPTATPGSPSEGGADPAHPVAPTYAFESAQSTQSTATAVMSVHTTTAPSAAAARGGVPPATQQPQQTSPDTGASASGASTTTTATTTPPPAAAPQPAAPGQPAALHHSASTASCVSTASSKKRRVKAGGLLVEGLEDDLKRLKLIRGLINDQGQYNCFLNVVIQSLWHLSCFRKAMLTAPMSDMEARGVLPADQRVATALQNIFHAFANAPQDISIEDMDEDDTHTTAAAAKAAIPPGGWAVSPTELREALSSLDNGRLAQQFVMGDMHDAAEVLAAIYNCLHSAELGSSVTSRRDPTLPQRVTAQEGAALAARGGGEEEQSIVQRLFGLEVQTPVVADERQDGFTMSNSRKTSSGSWQRVKNQGGRPLDAAGGRGGDNAKQPSPDVLWYTKYFHLVPSSSLRVVATQLQNQNVAFEDILRHAEAAATPRTTAQPPTVLLLRAPAVFTLSIVWDSPRATREAIAGTMRGIRPVLDLRGLFKMGPGVTHGDRAYHVRCLVCYVGHHYLSYALSEELHQWLLLDDTVIKLVGGWSDVLDNIVREQHQPSVLFYERA